MRLTIKLLDRKKIVFGIFEEYDYEGHSHIVCGFWKSLWDGIMILIHFMKEVKKTIKEEKANPLVDRDIQTKEKTI